MLRDKAKILQPADSQINISPGFLFCLLLLWMSDNCIYLWFVIIINFKPVRHEQDISLKELYQ